jgi:hypothetical protein
MAHQDILCSATLVPKVTLIRFPHLKLTKERAPLGHPRSSKYCRDIECEETFTKKAVVKDHPSIISGQIKEGLFPPLEVAEQIAN